MRYNRTFTSFFKGNGGTDAENKKWRWSWNANANNYYVLHNSNFTNNVGRRTNFTINNSIGQKLSIDINYNQITINGIKPTVNGTPGGTYLEGANRLLLFENTTTSGVMRWYWLDVYYNNELVGKLRPCVVDGVYNMVNLQTDTLCDFSGDNRLTGGFEE